MATNNSKTMGSGLERFSQMVRLYIIALILLLVAISLILNPEQSFPWIIATCAGFVLAGYLICVVIESHKENRHQNKTPCPKCKATKCSCDEEEEVDPFCTTIFFYLVITLIGLVTLTLMANTLPDENQLKKLILIGCFGGIGGTVYALREFQMMHEYQYSGRKELPEQAWWYFFRPIISVFCGAYMYFFLESGIIGITILTVNPLKEKFSYYVLAFLIGFCLDTFLSTIKELASRLFGELGEEYIKPANGRHLIFYDKKIIHIGGYLIIVSAMLVGLLLYPDSSTDERLFIYVGCSAGLGGIVYEIQSLYRHAGELQDKEEKFTANFIWWYYARPLISIPFGYIAYYFIKWNIIPNLPELAEDNRLAMYYSVAFLAGFSLNQFVKMVTRILKMTSSDETKAKETEKSTTKDATKPNPIDKDLKNIHEDLAGIKTAIELKQSNEMIRGH
jgi:hypothetical protein